VARWDVAGINPDASSSRPLNRSIGCGDASHMMGPSGWKSDVACNRAQRLVLDESTLVALLADSRRPRLVDELADLGLGIAEKSSEISKRA